MKKLILSAALVGALAGCNNKSDTDEELRKAKELKQTLLEIQEIKEQEALKIRKQKEREMEIEIEAKADILIEQAYQIEAASTLYTIGYDKPPKSMRDLMPDYIEKPEPPIDSVLGWFIIPENGFPAISLSSVESKSETNKKLCDSINKKGKIHNIRCENNYIYKLNQ